MSYLFSNVFQFWKMSPEEKEQLKILGNSIRNRRVDLNLSQFELSIRADIPKNQIGRIERAEINTTYLTLIKISKALEIQLKDLL